MFETIAVNADHIIGIRVSGRLTDEDYKNFLPVLEDLINREGPVSLYVDMENFGDFSAPWPQVSSTALPVMSLRCGFKEHQ